MSYQLSRKQWIISLVYGQSMITLLTVLNVFYHEYLGYTFIIFILGMVVFMAIMMKSQLKHITSKEAKEIKSGRRLYRSNPQEVKELQAKDHKLVQELKPMMKSAAVSFLGMIIILIWYPTYFGYARSIAEATTDVLIKVIVFLAGYEIPYALITTINMIARRSVKEMVQVVTNYEIYDKGVLGMGLTIKFPIDENSEYKVVVNPSRKFIEFVTKRGKTIIKYRLYTKSVERVADIIKRYGKPPEFKREEG